METSKKEIASRHIFMTSNITLSINRGKMGRKRATFRLLDAETSLLTDIQKRKVSF